MAMLESFVRLMPEGLSIGLRSLQGEHCCAAVALPDGRTGVALGDSKEVEVTLTISPAVAVPVKDNISVPEYLALPALSRTWKMCIRDSESAD